MPEYFEIYRPAGNENTGSNNPIDDDMAGRNAPPDNADSKSISYFNASSDTIQLSS